MTAASLELCRTPALFIPTTVRLGEKQRLLLEEQLLASKRRAHRPDPQPQPTPSFLPTKRTHRFLGELAVRPVTTQKVVGTSYHSREIHSMAKRKIRAFVRQFIGSIADVITTQ